MRCLIVDDSVHFAAAACALLEQQGITVVGVAPTGDEALRRLEEWRPDVALVDLNLGRENGFTVAERLHRAASTAVILISTHAAQEFTALIETSPAVGFLPKSAVSARAIHDLMRCHGGGDCAADQVNDIQGK
jgi:DNA-binding NarL/FixJ family response regulator